MQDDSNRTAPPAQEQGPRNKQDDQTSKTVDVKDIKGLSSADASERLKKYGYNEIRQKEETWLHRLFRRFWGPIPWMIEIAAVLAAVVRHWQDLIFILTLLFVNAFIDFYQESKALSAISVLKKKLARKSLALRDGQWQELDSRELVPGDIVKIKIGDIVPADARLLGGGDFVQVDQSALTGESLPVSKKAGDSLYANAVVKEGEMVAQVTATALNTYFGKTVKLVARAQEEEHSHFQKMVVNVGNFLIIGTLILVALIIYHGVINKEPAVELMIFSLVLVIAAIPIAMPAVLTVTMAIGARMLATRDAIVSRLAAIEELAGMDILCSDKTGTLTQNRMSLADPYVADDCDADRLMLYAALASQEENNDPIEKPIFKYIDQHKLREKFKNYKKTKFLPFDPVHKRTEGLYDDGPEGCVVFTKGAPQIIIEQCDETGFDKKAAYDAVESYAGKGFRALGVAYRKCDNKLYHFAGLIPLFDPPREDSKDTISEANAKGVNVKMVTGDNIAVARYIAKILGIGDRIESIRELKGESIEEYIYLSEVLTRAIQQQMHPEATEEEVQRQVQAIMKKVKRELYNMPLPKGTVKKHESELVHAIEAANGFAEVFPEDKYFIVDKLQKADHIVGMTGDGVNDAPALKKADCGIAVSGATDAARAAGDIILMAPGLNVIVQSIKEGRKIFERMKSYTIYRIAETIRIVIFLTLAVVTYDTYPLTAIMIIMLSLLNDLPIMTIAYDNTKVREKPVRWDMKEIFILATWLGLAGVFSSFLLFWVTLSVMHLPIMFVQSLFFTKMTVTGHGTLYNTRIDDWFFKRPHPSGILFSTTWGSALVGTIIAVYGFGMMEPVGWYWALALWAYALIFFVFNDAVKMAVLSYYRKKKGEDVI